MRRPPLPPVTNRFSGVLDAEAFCAECPWFTMARNAMGSGNLHARRTGHQVRVQQIIGVTYNRKDGVPNRYEP